jgi:O-antigen/teichoic acid export membrane protein/aminoglycoside phosphotransferase
VRSRLAAHFASPLLRSGYALAVNTVGTAGIGAVYWLIAARMYPAADVGVNAAVISAMVFLAKMGQLNLGNALIRFAPAAGRATRRFVVGSYLFGAGAAGVVAAGFVLGLSWWAPELDVIRSHPLIVGWFIAATMAWAVFVLQDAALTGVRRATWVPVENLTYGIAKVALLIGFAFLIPQIGIFASWTVPLLLLLPFLNLLLLRRAIPAHLETTRDRPTSFDAGAVARFAAGDFFASLGWMATIDLLPVIVIGLAGAEANAYFFLAWTIAYTLFLISRSTGTALISEAALEPGRLRSHTRRVLMQTMWLIVPAAALLIAFAPLVLGVFGAEYAAGGTTVLRLLTLSAVPVVVISLYASVARVERRLRAMGTLHGVLGAAVLGLSVVLIGPLGIAGVGWAWLGVTAVVAAVLLLTEMRLVWLPQALDSRPGKAAIGAARRIAAMLPGNGDSDDEALAIAVGRVRGRNGPLAVVGRPVTELDLATATLGSSPTDSVAIVKLARTRTASGSLLGEAAALRAIEGEGRLEGWPVAVPRLLGVGDVDGRAYTVQEHLDGVDGRTAVELGLDPDLAMVRAARAAADLHRRTASRGLLDPACIARLVDDPIDVLEATGGHPLPRRHLTALRRMRDRLREELSARPVVTSWVHGDYWLGNLLIGDGAEITGAVDWGGLDRDGLPDLDIMHLLLTTRSLRRSTELGTVVVDALEVPEWSEAEANVLGMITGRPAGEPLPWQALVLLSWVHHIASNLRKSDRYRGKWLWSTRNVRHVLEAV